MVHVFHQLRQKEGTAQFLRFCINGVIAASIHYGIYYLLQLWTDVNIAYTAGYLISFVYNFTVMASTISCTSSSSTSSFS